MKQKKFNRVSEFSSENLLTILYNQLFHTLYTQSYGKVNLSHERQNFKLMLRSITYSETETSILIMVKNDDIIEAIYSMATFTDTDSVVERVVFVIDERMPSTISGFIMNVFQTIMTEHTTQMKEEVKDGKTE